MWDDDARSALSGAFPATVVSLLLASGPDAMPMPNVLATLVRHPNLTGPFMAYNSVLLTSKVLQPRLRELIVLRVAWLTGSSYEWAQHVRTAKRAGISEDEVLHIPQGASAESWTPLERDLLAATDQLIESHIVDDIIWDRLSAELDERQLIEILFIVGTYAALAMVFNSVGLQLDDGLDEPPITRPQRGEAGRESNRAP
ncbi:MAG: carboxymuconolactone decarboxylase family protein [Ilumatobacteraceae bacterium]